MSTGKRHATYTVTMESGYVWTFEADLSEASAPLLTSDGESTPYQTADARHNPRVAAELLWPIECGLSPVDDDEIEDVS